MWTEKKYTNKEDVGYAQKNTKKPLNYSTSYKLIFMHFNTPGGPQKMSKCKHDHHLPVVTCWQLPKLKITLE